MIICNYRIQINLDSLNLENINLDTRNYKRFLARSCGIIIYRYRGAFQRVSCFEIGPDKFGVCKGRVHPETLKLSFNYQSVGEKIRSSTRGSR